MSARTRVSACPDAESIDPSKLELLPAIAESLYGDKLMKFGWKGTLEVLFAGTRDKKSPLSVLREQEATLIREIFFFISNQWAGHVKLTVPAALVGKPPEYFHPDSRMQFNHGRHGMNWTNNSLIDGASSRGFDDGFVSFASCARVSFPQPDNRNVNMMPFIFGEKTSLPDYLKCYYPLIEQCPYTTDDKGKVGFLTVHESYVDIGVAQRREGLHVERPGSFDDDPGASSFTPATEHRWGMGMFYGDDHYQGGIFMASSIADTSEVWDALVDVRVPNIADRHGGCEHLRGLIGQGTKLKADELIWMTDCTPHEALPQKESGYRQFFRVVTPFVTHWYEDHSTENPEVPLPLNVTVVRGNKFEV